MRCRRFGKQKRRKKRKAEETEEKERKAKAACRPYLLTIVSILSRLPYWGAGVWLRIPIPRPYPAPERRDRANVKGGKAVYIPLTFARAAIMGAGRGIGLNGGDKLGWGDDRHGEADARRVRGEGAHTTSPALRARTSPGRGHSEGD